MIKREFLMIRYMAFVMAITSIVFIATNVLIDPKGYLYLVTLPHINATKYFARGDRIEKSLRLEREGYKGVIVGTSRVQVGIDPNDQVFSGGAVYNVGLSGTNVYEIEKVMNYSLQHQKPEWMIWGLDFVSFTGQVTVSDNYKDSLFSGPGKSWFFKYLLDPSTFKLAIENTYMNIAGEHHQYGDKHGFLHKKVKEIDPRFLFDKVLIKTYLSRKTTYGAYKYSEDRLDRFRYVLEAYAKSKIKMFLFISPVHARQLEAIRALGLWTLYEQWKRDIVDVVEVVNKDTDGEVVLWDFSGYTTITTEPVPMKDARVPMQWYWESAHYKKEVGGYVVRKMFNKEVEHIPVDFGVLLDSANIDENLEKTRIDREAYAKEFVFEVSEVSRLVEQTAELRRFGNDEM